jgi:hypothetical protein
MSRQDSDDTFVIVEHTSTSKFVQFAGSVSKPLLLDLPWQTLSESEFYRAVDYFKKWGVAGKEEVMLDAPGGMPVGEQFTFQMIFRSIDAAVEVAIGIFEQVYQLPQDYTLNVIKGWKPNLRMH